MFRDMLTPCVCIRSYQMVSHLDQAIVFDISAIIMFSHFKSDKLFLLHGNGHLLFTASVYDI